MNGEIKIRAWSTANKVMYYDKNVSVLAKNIKDDNVWKYMLGTGLKDKNGVELYEADIFKFTNLNNEIAYYKVFRVKGGLVINTHSDDFNKDYIAFYTPIADMQTTSWFEKCCEIIGNIHETPELLK